jgi:hypothetical protein
MTHVYRTSNGHQMKLKQFYGEPDQFILKADNTISHLLNNILKRFRKISFFLLN